MDYTELRDRMVREQLIPRGISDPRVLDVFRRVERHEFISEKLRESAYADHPLPIGEGQTISQPYIVALMTECLGLKGNEKVLEIGTGSGYQTAVLTSLAKEVYSVERIALLAKFAKANLEKTGYRNVSVRVADGTLGWKEHAPYEGVIVTAAAPKIPQAYIDQLALGGRIVIPVGSRFSQVLTVLEKTAKGNLTSEACGCVFVPLVGRDGWK